MYNLPRGDLRPSQFDKDLTLQLSHAAKTVFLRFIDHIIVCDEAVYSIMSDGLL